MSASGPGTTEHHEPRRGRRHEPAREPGDELLDQVGSAVGTEHVLSDPELRARYETDWTGRYQGACIAVVRPGSTAEVAEVVRRCDASGVAVIAQGGNTGLVGASVPRDDHRAAIVLSLERFDDIGPVDPGAMQVTCGAGVTIADWRRAARDAGLDAPLDFAARDSATVGGAIATNAGGSRVVRFGTMRRHVVGVEAVLADGRIVGSLAGLPKETAGLHWPSVVSGSEGTVAVVTRARLGLVPRFAHTATALVALSSTAAALELLARARRELPSLDAIEILEPEALTLVSEHLGSAPPVAVPVEGTAVLVECADHVDPTDSLLELIADTAGVVDSAVATDDVRRQMLLDVRDRLTEAIAAAATLQGTPVFKLDVAVPVASLPLLLAAARRAARADGARLIAFGHLAEGNLHLNHLGAADTEQLAATVLGEVAALGGTISAEHGVGVAKARWLHLVRTAGELEAARAVRRALDPNGTLNPGVLDDAQVP